MTALRVCAGVVARPPVILIYVSAKYSKEVHREYVNIKSSTPL